jgi:hypothetical protein
LAVQVAPEAGVPCGLHVLALHQKPGAQLMSIAPQPAKQVVVLPHSRLPGHAETELAVHDPPPLQVSDVSWPLKHEVPQGVPDMVCSQAPPAAHLPSLPHGSTAPHWPTGAAVPGL